MLGWIGGPVAMTSYRVATSANANVARYAVAGALVETHQRSGEDGFRFKITIMTDYAPIRACGYDPAILLQSEKVPFLLSADWGYEVLRRREARDFKAITRESRASHFAEHHSVATMAALTECLNSPFAPLCRGKVDRMTIAADAAEAKQIAESQAFAREQDAGILCTFLDGAAARRGIAKLVTAPKSVP
ncbi:hypothetical protein [Sphingomonas sp. LT1P40]|uniref:hypothetical protein n=1 Tax=Alteristakelama amylovorans TaxID=3096166 RepID=UPI002FC82CF2